jgi:hypothetical protein
VIDMHRPETWGYVQFSSARPGTAAFVPDGSLPARRWLQTIYYAQRDYRQAHGHWAATFGQLGGPRPTEAGLTAPRMEITGSLFEVTIDLRVVSGRIEHWHIRQDSLLWTD